MRKFISVFLAFIVSTCIMTPVFADVLPTRAFQTTKTYTITDTQFQKDIYSKWKRLNSVFTARRKGETAHFNETKTVKTTSSLSISVPIKQISAELGYSVEKTKSNTIRGTNSAPLQAKESAAFYYRDHWKEYRVTYKVTEQTAVPTGFKGVGGLKIETKTYNEIKTIKVAQKLDSNDYGWFYSEKAKFLPSNLDSKYCDDDYSCKIK